MSNRFLFLTNRKNLIGIMSSGLIGTKEIYAKYQDDILTKTKGFLPLFNSGVSGQLIELSTENIDTNFGVILEFKKDKLPSKFTYGLNSKGELQKEVGLDDPLILRLSSDVLSTNMIQEIHFSSDNHLRAFKALMFDNAPINAFIFTVSPKLFNAESPFPIEYFENIKDSKVEDKERIARISDKFVASIALFSERIESDSDFMLFNSLLTHPYTAMNDGFFKEEYNTIAEVFDSIVTGVNLNNEMSADYRLLHITLTELISLDVKSGWVALDFLDKIQSNYQNSITNIDEGAAIWFESCRKYINREDEIDKRIFSDDKNIIRRAIFFFLLRPNYDDIIEKENSYLDPGDFVKKIAIMIAGFRIGYARLSIQFKDFHHQIFAPLKADIINYELGKVSGGYEKKFISNVQAIVNIKTGTHKLEYKLLKEPIEAEIDKEIIAMEAEAQRINDQEIARKLAKDKTDEIIALKHTEDKKRTEAKPINDDKAKEAQKQTQPINEELKIKDQKLNQDLKDKFERMAAEKRAKDEAQLAKEAKKAQQQEKAKTDKEAKEAEAQRVNEEKAKADKEAKEAEAQRVNEELKIKDQKLNQDLKDKFERMAAEKRAKDEAQLAKEAKKAQQQEKAKADKKAKEAEETEESDDSQDWIDDYNQDIESDYNSQ